MSLSENFIMRIANFSPSGFDNSINMLAHSGAFYRYLHNSAKRALSSIKEMNRILIVSDTNIGDAVVLQSPFALLKHYFPECDIDYIYQQKAYPLIHNNPYIHKSFPYFVDSNFTSQRNNKAIADIITENNYDLIINLYPFFTNGELKNAQCPIISSVRLIANIIQSQASSDEVPHISYQVNRFINKLVDILPTQIKPGSKISPPDDNRIYLPKKAYIKTQNLLEHYGIPADAKVAFLNPDTSSKYTLIPFDLQVEMVKGILLSNHFDYLLIGPAYSFQGIERDLYEQIPAELRDNKLIMVPKRVSIETYAGLMDRSDLFITGDTAQMHIAVAQKVCIHENDVFRNHTALISVFGATNSKVYGYDSASDKHLPGNQDAPAKVFEGHPSCKNLTCIHKTRKKCEDVRCFTGIKADHILEYINNHLSER